MDRIDKKILALLNASILSWLLIYINNQDLYNIIDKVFAFLLSMILFFIGSLVLTNQVRKIKIKFNKIKIMMIGIVVIVYAITLTIAFSQFTKEISYTGQLEIEAVESSNAKSKGQEVWIQEILIDGRPVDLSEIKLNNSWEMINGRVVSYQDRLNKLLIDITYQDSLEIKFINHPYSGQVKVKVGNEIHQIDLYNDNEIIEGYIIGPIREKIPITDTLLKYIIYIFISTIIILTIFSLSNSFKKGSLYTLLLLLITIVILFLKYYK